MRQRCFAVTLFQKVFAQGETLRGGSASIRASYDDLILFKNKHQAPVAVRNKSWYAEAVWASEERGKPCNTTAASKYLCSFLS